MSASARVSKVVASPARKLTIRLAASSSAVRCARERAVAAGGADLELEAALSVADAAEVLPPAARGADSPSPHPTRSAASHEARSGA